MPTIITHAALPLLVGSGLGRKRISGRLMVAGALVAMLPDADVIGFVMGIPYDSALGHRGISHSLVMALVTGLLAVLLHKKLNANSLTTFLFVSLSMVSHGLADMLTNGGHGIMLFWPFDEARHFASWQPIQVSPIGVERFLERGPWRVLESEFLILVAPTALLGLSLRLLLPRPVDSGAARS